MTTVTKPVRRKHDLIFGVAERLQRENTQLKSWMRRWDKARVTWSDGDSVSVVLSKELRAALAGAEPKGTR